MLTNPKSIPQAQLKDYICFGDVSRNRMGKQCQYGSRYVDGRFPEEYPDLASCPKYGAPLRILGKPGDYHDYKIHKADVEELVRRYKNYLDERDSDDDSSANMLALVPVLDLRPFTK